jgi:hypothetical protein
VTLLTSKNDGYIFARSSISLTFEQCPCDGMRPRQTVICDPPFVLRGRGICKIHERMTDKLNGMILLLVFVLGRISVVEAALLMRANCEKKQCKNGLSLN